MKVDTARLRGSVGMYVYIYIPGRGQRDLPRGENSKDSDSEPRRAELTCSSALPGLALNGKSLVHKKLQTALNRQYKTIGFQFYGSSCRKAASTGTLYLCTW